jgi:carboxyl-terminal processing protease
MLPVRNASRWVICLWMVMAVLLLGQAQDVAAADASLVVTALRVLEQRYVDPVRPVPVLNAAIAELRDETHLGPAKLPDISPSATEFIAARTFTTEFAQAALAAAVPRTQLAYDAITRMLASLHDSHTYFLDPRSLTESQRELEGIPSFTGIGMTVVYRRDASGSGWVFVENVIPGSPAEKAGLRPFDKIIGVDGKSLKNLDPEVAGDLLRGPEGSSVTLLVQRMNEPVNITAVRTSIRLPSISTRLLEPGIAYVKVYGFSEGAGMALRADLRRLASTGPIRSVVLDLRGDPGGFILEAADIAGIFLSPHTILAEISDRDSSASYLETSGYPLLADTPLALLVDGGSASASEILAGAFKDYRRATVIGERTAGALGGSITVVLPEGGMSVTVERIAPPGNERVEGVGIAPDIRVPLGAADMERARDVQLEAAVRVLRSYRQPPALSHPISLVLNVPSPRQEWGTDGVIGIRPAR